MCNNKIVEQNYEKLDAFIKSIEDKDGALITILHKAQGLFGYLPREVQIYISRKLNIPAAQVNGVVTFYSYFTEVPKGKHVISVCLGTACFVRGAEEILTEIENKLGIKAGQTTSDGKYTIDCLRCVGACGLAPIVTVDGQVHARLTKNDVAGLFKPAK